MKWLKVFLAFTCFFSCSVLAVKERTLAFVFDVTFSMVSDLEHLKYGIQEIFLNITSQLDQRYTHYMFLGFHDPGKLCTTMNRHCKKLMGWNFQVLFGIQCTSFQLLS